MKIYTKRPLIAIIPENMPAMQKMLINGNLYAYQNIQKKLDTGFR